MRSPTLVTVVLLASAVTMVTLVHADPWASERAPAPMLSTQSAARRLFPALAEADLARATITMSGTHGAVKLAPEADGLHHVYAAEDELGWADIEALAGLWSSLRMATTLRAIAPGSPQGAKRGEILIDLDDRTFGVAIYGEASDGAGLHGELMHDEGAWVVEQELGAVLDQPAEAWLLRRLLPIEPGDAVAVRWNGPALARGADGLWRVSDGAPKLLLADQAVALRLGQGLAAEVDPLIARDEAAQLGPFVDRHAVTDAIGRVRTVLSGGTCPGHPDRVVVDRGPGLLGCVAAEALAGWPVGDPDAGLVEPQLAPHAYGRVLAIEQHAPVQRRLRRFGGSWVIEEGGNLVEVAEPEVFRWYSALQASEVELTREDLGPGFKPLERLTIETDSGQRLTLACGPAGSIALACARDEGPPLRVLGTPPELAFSRETFADRRLLSFVAGELRSLELLPGPSSDGVRQSVRLDLGVWRLDAPTHPDGVAVLDEVRLESLLAALQGLRAEAWTPVPTTAPQRTLRIERGHAGKGDDGSLSVDLHLPRPELPAICVGHVPGQPQAARLSESTCAALQDDLLYNDPLRFWLTQARSIQLTDRGGADERVAMLRREGPATEEGASWSVESGEPALLAELPRWVAFRSAGLRSGEPRGATAIEAKIWRNAAAAIRVDLGPIVDGAPAWVRLAGAPWYYLAGPPEPASP